MTRSAYPFPDGSSPVDQSFIITSISEEIYTTGQNAATQCHYCNLYFNNILIKGVKEKVLNLLPEKMRLETYGMARHGWYARCVLRVCSIVAWKVFLRLDFYALPSAD